MSEEKQIFMKVSNYRNFDDYYIPVNDDGTWNDALVNIEAVLDEKYCENEKIEGIKIELEFVMEYPSNIALEE